MSDLDGNIYIADRDNHRMRRVRRVRRVNDVYLIESFIGTGVAGANGLDHPVKDIQLNAPFA